MADLTPIMQMWKLRLTKVKPLATINKQRWAWKTVAPPQSQHLKLWPMAHEARHHRLLGSPPTGPLAPSGPATWPLHCSSSPAEGEGHEGFPPPPDSVHHQLPELLRYFSSAQQIFVYRVVCVHVKLQALGGQSLRVLFAAITQPWFPSHSISTCIPGT